MHVLMKFLVLIILTSLLFTDASAQPSRHVVYLKNKGATSFTLANPSQYLSARAIARRTAYGIAIDSTDLPVPSSYLQQIGSIPGVTILNTSRWMNAVAIDTTDNSAMAAINALPFVKSTEAIAAKTGSPGKILVETNSIAQSQLRPQEIEVDHYNYGAGSLAEIRVQKGEFLHNIGLRGQTMQIAMLDAGFFNYTTLDAFDSAVLNGQILSTWDFVNRETSVVEDNSHGMMCLSTIAANIPGQFVGKAPKASFHLYKTEDVTSEHRIEEFNWICGAERADSAGANVISSSLGYNTFDIPSMNYEYADMDGDTPLATKGADMAARKGILVFNAVGNYGSQPWKFLATPADGDSVVAVGAVNIALAVWSGSSYGPSADGRIKPDVSSVGWNAIVQGVNNTVGVGTGTSFACPNMAGLATCLWQGFPEFNNMRIVRALKEAGSVYNNPNDRIGYGIPDMKKAFTDLLIEYATSTVVVNGCSAALEWRSKDMNAMRYEIERKLPTQANYVKIADVNATGGSILSNKTYAVNSDLTNVAAGTISFRVRQIVDTASASFTAVYIDTFDVVLSSQCIPTSTPDPDPVVEQLSVRPNPTEGDVKLVIGTRDAIADLRIIVFDMKGRRMMEMKDNKGSGVKNFLLNTSSFSTGTYVVQVFDKNKRLGSVEFIKMK